MEELDVYELAILLSKRCTQEELVLFCAAMKVNYENVIGVADTLPASALKLTGYFQARDKLGVLWQKIREIRPDLADIALPPKAFQQIFAKECQQLRKDVLFEYYDELLSLFIENPDTVMEEQTGDVKPEFTPIQVHLKKKLDRLITEAESDKHKFYYLKAKLQFSVGNLESCRRILHNHCTDPNESRYSEMMLKCLCELITKTCDKEGFDENDKRLTKEWLGDAETCLRALNLDEESDEYRLLENTKTTLQDKVLSWEKKTGKEERENQLIKSSIELQNQIQELWDSGQADYHLANRLRSLEHATRAIEESDKLLGLLDKAETEVREHFQDSDEFLKKGLRLFNQARSLKTQLEREQNDE